LNFSISFFLVSTELIQQKQRADDLEEEIQLIKKHLKNTQNKVAEQVNDHPSFSFRFHIQAFLVPRNREFKSNKRCL
jgi:hypothetical protein